MAINSLIAQDEILRLSEEYSTPYNAIIRAHVVMGVSRYFLERWVPLLGTAPATIVNTLRQLTYHTPQPISISGKVLAQEAAMSRRHLYTCLETPWLRAFIQVVSGQQKRSQTGKVVQEANRYHVRMDDPLSPADADNLMLQLRREATDPLEAAIALISQQPRDIWAPNPRHLSANFPDPMPITAHTVLKRAFPNWKPANEEELHLFSQVAETLHGHITLVRADGKTSKIIVPQYFRTRWWPLLGHDLAWSYLWLRSTVYDNPQEGIVRNTCWIQSLERLLNLIDRPREWWRRNVERNKFRAEGWSTADFFEQIATQKGYDPEHPQRVARQILVRSEIPVAPSDREIYSKLLIEWPEVATKIPVNEETTSATLNPGNEAYIKTHSKNKGLPHSNSPTRPLSNTFKHTEILPLRHKRTQGCATNAHRESESLKALKKTSPNKRSKHSPNRKHNTIAAANKEKKLLPDILLSDLLKVAAENTPEKPLYKLAEVEIWLQQAWPEAINPHTPAWTIAKTKKISRRDLVALMLSVWADPTINQPPRYISWVLQQWQTQPHNPPANQWKRWQALAELPIGQWKTRGKREWLELTSGNHRELPFKLETIFFELSSEFVEVTEEHHPPATLIEGKTFSIGGDAAEAKNRKGLDEPIGDGQLTIYDVWRATLSQLSLKMQRSIYTNWIDGAQAVAYKDGMLTVQAKHFMAREQLTRRFNPIIEQTLSDLAKFPITIRYVL